MNKITSSQNQKIKDLVRLIEKPSERKEQGLIVIEGRKEITFAVQAGFEITQVFWCPDVTDSVQLFEFLGVCGLDEDMVTEINEAILEKIAWRENSQGLVALAKSRTPTLEQIVLSGKPVVIILESVEKPGNLGAILRTADAAGADAVIICDPKTDIYNPNAIRASVGCVFTVQVASCSSPEALEWLRKNKIKSYAASLKGKNNYQQVDFREASAIVMGTESEGLSDFWHHNADELIKIPMRGKIDSLNVSTSAAILVFEAMRQRGF